MLDAGCWMLDTGYSMLDKKNGIRLSAFGFRQNRVAQLLGYQVGNAQPGQAGIED